VTDIESGFNDLRVEGKPWKEFLKWFQTHWKLGEHIALVGPTGSGKTVYVVNILPMRKYVIALDAKGGDESLELLTKHGFSHSTWPLPRQDWKDIEEGKPKRVIVGSGIQSLEDLPILRTEISTALKDAYDQKRWTVYIDELQLVADRRLMNLSARVEVNLIAARNRGVSIVSSFQRPANVPRSASEMSTWFIVFYTRDRDTVDRLAEMAGRATSEIRGMIKGLPEFCTLIFSRNPREPVIVTRAPPPESVVPKNYAEKTSKENTA
jgi:hypothetical protein